MAGRAYYNEIDPYAAEWLRNLIAAGLITAGDVDTRSIVDVRPSDLEGYERCHFFAGIGGWDYALNLAGWPAGRPVWTGSCPCQPFSAAGRQAGFADERHLWPAWFDLIRQCGPDAVLGEQVEAAVRLGWLDAVFSDLEGQGYACGAVVLGAHSVGAPHIRQRLWFVADASGERCDGEPARLWQPDPRGWVAADRVEAAGRSQTRFVADTDGRDAGAEGLQRGGQHGLVSQDGGPVPHRWPGAHHGGWDDADWLRCRDGKWRPVEPGTFPLVDGASFRLGSGSAFEGKSRSGMLKGYGNAINAEAATAFIGAVIDTLSPSPSESADGGRR